METPEQDHYVVLGVEHSVTADEIKVAYRKLAMTMHPDKNGNSEVSTAAFQKVCMNDAVASDGDLWLPTCLS